MSTGAWIEPIVAGVAVICLALASWSEIHLSATSRVNVRRLLDERFARLDEQEIERNQRVRAEMMLVELLSGAVAAVLLTDIFRRTLDSYGLLLGLGISAVILIGVGRVWPRVAAGHDPDIDAPRVRRTARVLSFLFAPVIRPVTWLTERLLRDGTHGAADELSSQAAESNGNGKTSIAGDGDEGEIEQDEQEMISGVLHLDRATAHDIMVPRIDVVGLASNVLVSEAVDIAIQAGHSRIPVYGRSIDEIVGVVYAKDLLRFVNQEHEGITVGGLLRDAHFVPESKRVDDLLSELQQAKVHLAVVVDEYGGTAGVVTIEDILEEIVGEIQDEFDSEQLRVEILSDDEAIADGALSIDDLADDIDLDWPEPVSGTIGGLMQRRLGRVLTEGEVVEFGKVRLTVLRVERRRVRLVRIERLRETRGADDPNAVVEAPISR